MKSTVELWNLLSRERNVFLPSIKESTQTFLWKIIIETKDTLN